MYGGGFATVPAYLADIFGTQMVGAIHGRLLTAWSVAGIVGPVVIAAVRENQLASGVAARAGLRPDAVHHGGAAGRRPDLQPAGAPGEAGRDDDRPRNSRDERSLGHEDRASASAETAARGSFGATGVVAWLAVGVPFFIGLVIALQKAAGLF